jgi:hypothetical protein
MGGREGGREFSIVLRSVFQKYFLFKNILIKKIIYFLKILY